MAKRISPLSIEAARAAYDSAYSRYQIAYDWLNWLGATGNHVLDAVSAHAKRMEQAVKAASAFEPHEDIGALFGEHDRLMGEYKGVIACRKAARRVVDAAYKEFLAAERAEARAEARARRAA